MDEQTRQRLEGQLAAAGVDGTTVLHERRRNGYPDYLIECAAATETLRGWWRHGESAEDIRWVAETTAGWPEDVRMEDEPRPLAGH